jgi:F-type H+-transporting ATPase subunit delta
VSAFARRYAQACLDSMPKGFDVERFLDAAHAVARAMSDEPRLRAFFASPAVPLAAKKKTLSALAEKAGVDSFGARFLDLALERGRALRLPEILAALRSRYDEESGVVAAKVTIAAPVGEEERLRIAEALGRRVGREVRIDLGVDEKILGGFVAKVGSEVFDASVRHAVERFQRQTKERAGT